MKNHPLDKLNTILALAVVLGAFFLIQLRAISHFPYFDESVHCHYLWLISRGLTPHVDFWGTYPVLGYLFTLPVFRIFPDTAYRIFALRFFTTVLIAILGGLFTVHGRRIARSWIWGGLPFILLIVSPGLGGFFTEYSIDHYAAVSAAAALVLVFSPPTECKKGAVAFLAVLSVIFTPKYLLPLAGAGTGYYLFCLRCRNGRLRTILSILAGGAAAAVLVGAVFLFFRVSFFRNFYWSSFFTSGYIARVISSPGIFSRQGVAILSRYWPILILGAGGIAAWARSSFHPARSSAWAGTGLLAGILLTLFGLNPRFEQYLAPLLLSLVIFVPYFFLIFSRFRFPGLITLGLIVLTGLNLGGRLELRARELSGSRAKSREPFALNHKETGRAGRSSALRIVSFLDDLLTLIPEDEKVVGVWYGSPIFRRDQTFITYDMGASFKDFISDSSKESGFFSPDYFAESLENDPPALICLFNLHRNYPPGWLEVAFNFIRNNSDRYTMFYHDGLPFHIRDDLIEKNPEAFAELAGDQKENGNK